MAQPKLLGLLALAFLAFAALSSAPIHVSALVADRAQVARHVHAHNAAAKRKRKRTDPSTSGQCIPRSSSPASSLSTSTSTSTSTTPLPSSTTPAASAFSSGSGPKWGLGWAADDTYLPNFAFSNIKLLYTWSPEIPSNLPQGISGAPMLWGYNQISQFQQLVIPGYASYVLGPNEPNVPSQSNMSPEDAVSLWRQYIQPLASQGYTLVSPACTADDTGTEWYSQFFTLCVGCTFHAIAFHCYNTDAQYLIDYATMLHNTFKLPLWITEFADQDFNGGAQATMNEVWDFAGQIKSFVDNTSWIEMAIPFGAMVSLPDNVNLYNILMQPDGSPTPLAEFYFS